MTATFDPKAMHKQAMLYAQEAMVAQKTGQQAEAIALYEQAFALEKQVAFSFLTKNSSEPTRSILFRSAASLAKNLGHYREAEQLVAYGLAGDPPDEIADELRNLYEDINLYRHLDLKEPLQDAAEMQLSISGDGVGYGLAPADEVSKRISVIEQLAVRTAERITGKDYRTSGQASKELRSQFRFYQSVPQAASFTVKIRLGKPSGQMALPFAQDVEKQIIDDIVKGIDLINTGQEDRLKEWIPNEDYRQNFISLIKAISPDGSVIRQVGLTISRHGEPQSVALVKTKSDMAVSERPNNNNQEIITGTTQIVGYLKFANATTNQIHIIPESGKPQKIIVPSGLSDIVKIYWEDEVQVTLLHKGRSVVLGDIEKVY